MESKPYSEKALRAMISFGNAINAGLHKLLSDDEQAAFIKDVTK